VTQTPGLSSMVTVLRNITVKGDGRWRRIITALGLVHHRGSKQNLNNPSCSFFPQAKLLIRNDKKLFTQQYMDKSNIIKIKMALCLSSGSNRGDENSGQVVFYVLIRLQITSVLTIFFSSQNIAGHKFFQGLVPTNNQNFL
jgi:hypothetical protein